MNTSHNMEFVTMDSDEIGCLALAAGGLGFIIGVVLTVLAIIWINDNSIHINSTDPTQGVPIHDMQLSSDGLLLTFYIGSSQWQAQMATAISRPPNIEQPFSLSIEGDQMLFLTAEGKSFFDSTVTYIGPLLLLKG